MDTATPTPPEIKPGTEAPKADPILDAFALELQRLISEAPSPLTPRHLNLIIQTASAARDLLALRNPRVRQRCGGTFAGYGSSMSGPLPNPIGPYDDDLEPRMGPDRETFGAKILRELVAVIPQVSRTMREDPAQIVKAIAEARANGMDDIATQLEERLRGEPPNVTAMLPSSRLPPPQPIGTDPSPQPTTNTAAPGQEPIP